MLESLHRLTSHPDFFWWVLGFSAQFMFFLRFLVQWIVTEKKKEITIPPVFWYLSVTGAIGILVYAWHRKDPVFIIGPCMSLVIYSRNIYFLKRNR